MAGGVAPRREPATGAADLIGSLVAALVEHGDTDQPHAAGPPAATIDGDDADAAELARLLADRLAELEAGGGDRAR